MYLHYYMKYKKSDTYIYRLTYFLCILSISLEEHINIIVSINVVTYLYRLLKLYEYTYTLSSSSFPYNSFK